jgi:hypothetical protein
MVRHTEGKMLGNVEGKPMGNGLFLFMQQRKEKWKGPVQKRCGSALTKHLEKNKNTIRTIFWDLKQCEPLTGYMPSYTRRWYLS